MKLSKAFEVVRGDVHLRRRVEQLPERFEGEIRHEHGAKPETPLVQQATHDLPAFDRERIGARSQRRVPDIAVVVEARIVEGVDPLDRQRVYRHAQ